MAILVLPASFCMMAGLSCAHSPIRRLYGNALESIVDGKLHIYIPNTLIRPALLLSTWGWLLLCLGGIETLLTVPRFGSTLVILQLLG